MILIVFKIAFVLMIAALIWRAYMGTKYLSGISFNLFHISWNSFSGWGIFLGILKLELTHKKTKQNSANSIPLIGGNYTKYPLGNGCYDGRFYFTILRVLRIEKNTKYRKNRQGYLPYSEYKELLCAHYEELTGIVDVSERQIIAHYFDGVPYEQAAETIYAD